MGLSDSSGEDIPKIRFFFDAVDANLNTKTRYKRDSSSPSLSRNHCFNDLESKMADDARNGGKFVIPKTGQMLPTAVEFPL